METKSCTKCQEDKPLESYGKRSDNNKLLSWCRACYASANMTPERKARRRDASLMKKYGITSEVYDQLMLDQNGACAICRSNLAGNINSERLYVDHDHTTGEVRGLLCHPCNVAIGLMKDDPDVLLDAATYLLRNRNVLPKELPNITA